MTLFAESYSGFYATGLYSHPEHANLRFSDPLAIKLLGTSRGHTHTRTHTSSHKLLFSSHNTAGARIIGDLRHTDARSTFLFSLAHSSPVPHAQILLHVANAVADAAKL
ncbi:unnamed protein product [Caenorhabditis auriculariae]|uniref:Uncharacterized protein n=1 Tax=Caenorhabditis auriculariae TaxID=2777116 RepID=A0A8S1GQZ1_9PELO|nr:unnamed protein product [Caenorhabditis auriculariae]